MVELVIYDNDGPEGYFERLKFERSHQAVQYIFDHYRNSPDFTDMNFEITNNYNKKDS